MRSGNPRKGRKRAGNGGALRGLRDAGGAGQVGRSAEPVQLQRSGVADFPSGHEGGFGRKGAMVGSMRVLLSVLGWHGFYFFVFSSVFFVFSLMFLSSTFFFVDVFLAKSSALHLFNPCLHLQLLQLQASLL